VPKRSKSRPTWNAPVLACSEEYNAAHRVKRMNMNRKPTACMRTRPYQRRSTRKAAAKSAGGHGRQGGRWGGM